MVTQLLKQRQTSVCVVVVVGGMLLRQDRVWKNVNVCFEDFYCLPLDKNGPVYQNKRILNSESQLMVLVATEYCKHVDSVAPACTLQRLCSTALSSPSLPFPAYRAPY